MFQVYGASQNKQVKELPKNLLFISPHFPFPPTEGGMIRTYSLVMALCQGWAIHYVPLRNSGDPFLEPPNINLSKSISNFTLEWFDLPAKINFVERMRAQPRLRFFLALGDLCYGLQKHWKIRQFVSEKLQSRQFDVLLFDYTKMAHHAALIGGRDVIKIVNTHNVESDVARQTMVEQSRGLVKAGHWLRWKLYETYERLFLSKCDFLLASSQADADFYRKLAPNINAVVIPNAVDTDILQTLAPPEEPHSVIFPGRMDYPPNFQAVHIFCQEILPRVAVIFPSVRFYIVGKNPPESVRKLASDRVVVTGFVEDMLPFWRKAAALVVPLSIGGGTRIKILEAMALGRPVISTSKGCEGLEVIHEKHLLIADDPERFAEHVIRVLKNPEEYFEMSRAARKLVEEKYSFAAIGNLLLRTLEDTVSEP